MKRVPFLKKKAWIPEEMLEDETVLENWRLPIFDEKVCARCQFKKLRPSESCDGCEGYTKNVRLFEKVETPEGAWWGVPNGNMPKVQKLTGITEFEDKRTDCPFDHPIEFNFALYTGEPVNGKPTANQEEVVDTWCSHGYGLVKAPPRAGKTIMAVASSIRMGTKTLIVAHEERLIQQFYATFMAATNLGDLEKETGKTLIKILENPDVDLQSEDLQIGLTTYQKFIQKDSRDRRIALLNKKFGMCVVDEIHQGSSEAYARFLAKLSARYKMGLSATPLRKDGLDYVMAQVWGPIVAEAFTIAMTPRIELLETGIPVKGAPKNWSTFVKNMTMGKRRTQLIVDEVFSDIAAGRQCIIIPVDNKDPGRELVAALNTEARRRETEEGEHYPMQFAAFYDADSKKKGYLEKLDAGEITVLVAIRSMVKQGIDFQRADMLYMVVPMSAEKDRAVGAPLFEQLSFRVGTWTPDKKDPTLKLFIDDHFFSTATFVGLMRYEIVPGLKPKGQREPKYKMDVMTKMRANQIMKEGRGYKPRNKPGERLSSEQIMNRPGPPESPKKKGRFTNPASRVTFKRAKA